MIFEFLLILTILNTGKDRQVVRKNKHNLSFITI